MQWCHRLTAEANAQNDSIVCRSPSVTCIANVCRRYPKTGAIFLLRRH